MQYVCTLKAGEKDTNPCAGKNVETRRLVIFFTISRHCEELSQITPTHTMTIYVFNIIPVTSRFPGRNKLIRRKNVSKDNGLGVKFGR
jgi:hypothetical protein